MGMAMGSESAEDSRNDLEEKRLGKHTYGVAYCEAGIDGVQVMTLHVQRLLEPRDVGVAVERVSGERSAASAL